MARYLPATVAVTAGITAITSISLELRASRLAVAGGMTIGAPTRSTPNQWPEQHGLPVVGQRLVRAPRK